MHGGPFGHVQTQCLWMYWFWLWGCYNSHRLFYFYDSLFSHSTPLWLIVPTLCSTMTHCSHTPLHHDSLFSRYTPLWPITPIVLLVYIWLDPHLYSLAWSYSNIPWVLANTFWTLILVLGVTLHKTHLFITSPLSHYKCSLVLDTTWLPVDLKQYKSFVSLRCRESPCHLITSLSSN